MTTNSENSFEEAEMTECDGEKVVTMVDVLKEQQDFEEDANAVLGASDDKNCTYSKGYVKRQAIYACMTCCAEAKNDPSKRAGVCLACSLICHETHELIELYTKRNFRCDCGNPNFNSHPCQFTSTKSDLNDNNIYNQNFSGLYCTCHRPYPDPECAEEDEMIQCIICEDWHHALHLEALVPPNDQYSEMICKGCMEKNPFLYDYSDLTVNAEDSDIDVTFENGSVSQNLIPNGNINHHETVTIADIEVNGTEIIKNKNDESCINSLGNNKHKEPTNIEPREVNELKPTEQDDKIETHNESLVSGNTIIKENDLQDAEINNDNISIEYAKTPEKNSKFGLETSVSEFLENEEQSVSESEKTAKDGTTQNESKLEADKMEKGSLSADPRTEEDKQQKNLNVANSEVEKTCETHDNDNGEENNKLDENGTVDENNKVHESKTVGENGKLYENLKVGEYDKPDKNYKEDLQNKIEVNLEPDSTQTTEQRLDEAPTTLKKLDGNLLGDQTTNEISQNETSPIDTIEKTEEMVSLPDSTDVKDPYEMPIDQAQSKGAVLLDTKHEDDKLEGNVSEAKLDEDISQVTETDEYKGINTIESKENLKKNNIEELSPNNIHTISGSEDIDMSNENKTSSHIDNNEIPTFEQKHMEENVLEYKRKLSAEDTTEEEAVCVKRTKLSEVSLCVKPKEIKKICKGATFWPSHFRQKLCTCNECLSMYKELSVLFLIDPEDTASAYYYLGQAKEGQQSQYEKGLEALSSLDRIQQINALTEYNKMKDKLLDFLKSFKDRQEVVKEEDIKAFFAGMKPKREPDGVYFCR